MCKYKSKQIQNNRSYPLISREDQNEPAQRPFGISTPPPLDPLWSGQCSTILFFPECTFDQSRLALNSPRQVCFLQWEVKTRLRKISSGGRNWGRKSDLACIMGTKDQKPSLCKKNNHASEERDGSVDLQHCHSPQLFNCCFWVGEKALSLGYGPLFKPTSY